MTPAEATRVPRPPYRPWLQRHIDASGLSHPSAGILIALAQLALFFGWHGLGWLLGPSNPRDPWFWEQMFGPNLINAALIGYAPAAMAWSHQRAREELARLAPRLGGEAGALSDRLGRFPRWPMAACGASFSLLILPILVLDPYMRHAFERADWIQATWIVWVNAVVGWLLTRAVLEELRIAHLFARAGERIGGIDPFDLQPLAPFSQRAVEGVLVWVVAASLLSLIFAGEGWASDSLPWLVAAILVPAAIAFALPLRGVHRSIRAARLDELARVHGLLREARARLLAGGSGAAEAQAQLPALLALRAQLAELREWPVDLPTLARLAGFLAIGLLSWVGAALVDVAIEAVLR